MNKMVQLKIWKKYFEILYEGEIPEQNEIYEEEY